MKTSKKTKAFDAVAASRRWRARSSRELAGLSYEQLHVRLSRFASAEALVKPAPRRNAARSRGATASLT
ncbi:MAG: hypothetical protein ABIZ81_17615 [Opitutaceae bacterium]